MHLRKFGKLAVELKCYNYWRTKADVTCQMLSIESWEASSKLLIYSTQPNILPVLPFDGPENNLLGSRDTLLMEMMPVKQKYLYFSPITSKMKLCRPIARWMSSSLNFFERKHRLRKKLTISFWCTSHSPVPALLRMWSGNLATRPHVSWDTCLNMSNRYGIMNE